MPPYPLDLTVVRLCLQRLLPHRLAHEIGGCVGVLPNLRVHGSHQGGRDAA